MLYKTKRSLLTALSLISLASLLLTLLVFRFGDESYWPVLLVVSVPPILLAVPVIVLFGLSCAARQRAAIGVSLLSLLLVAGPIMGFHWRWAAAPASGRTVRVMTWNVEKWSHGPDAVARGVRAERLDIVCFQEAGDYPYIPGPQGKGLIAALPEYHFVRSGEIIVAARWPVVKIAETALPPGPSSRPALSVAVAIGGGQCVVTSAHLIPSEYDKHLTDPREPIGRYARWLGAARESQGEALMRAMDTGSSPKILCGDFNAQPQARVCRRLTRAYPDAFEAAGRGYGYTLTATAPVMRIDHILTSRDVVVRDCWVPNIVASDHRPVVADIMLPPPQSP